jgi:hypothetical protein
MVEPRKLMKIVMIRVAPPCLLDLPIAGRLCSTRWEILLRLTGCYSLRVTQILSRNYPQLTNISSTADLSPPRTFLPATVQDPVREEARWLCHCDRGPGAERPTVIRSQQPNPRNMAMMAMMRSDMSYGQYSWLKTINRG